MNLVTGFARIDGHTVAIMANQPKVRGGAIDMNALIKARRMVNTARTFSLPLLTFCDTPGIMTTQEEEHKGLLTETTVYISEKMESEVPTVCVTLGKGIGDGLFHHGLQRPGGDHVLLADDADCLPGSRGRCSGDSSQGAGRG